MANISEINGYGIYAQTASLALTASLATFANGATFAASASSVLVDKETVNGPAYLTYTSQADLNGVYTLLYNNDNVYLTGSTLVIPRITSSFTGSLLGTASFATTSSYARSAGIRLDQSVNPISFKLIDANNSTISTLSNPTSSLALTASYIDPTFISASAAASGFGSGGGINDQLVALSGSNITTTSATLVDITGLVTPTLPTSSAWYFEIYLATTCTGTGGIKFGFTAPSGGTGFLYVEGISTTVTGYQSTVTTGTITGVGVTRVNGNAGVRLFGRISIDTTPGVVQIQFASGTGGQTSTIGAGNGASIMRLTRTA
jgi:hypothetical protein